MDSLRRVLPRLVALKPTFFTVTYGAMGTTRIRTVEIASMIRNEFAYEVASHLTCVGATRIQIEGQLERMRTEGIENLVALRGDPPQGQEEFVAVEGGYSYAAELVRHIRAKGEFGIAVAGYPEKHVEAPDLDTDLNHLKAKVDAGADIVVTQLFYDNADFFRFVDLARERGIEVPIVPGLLPLQSYPQIKKITSLCGAKIPDELASRLDSAGDDEDAVRDIGTQWSLEQARGLLQKGVPGIHFYVLNKAPHMERIMTGLRDDGLLGADDA